jgi:hypothetical protein
MNKVKLKLINNKNILIEIQKYFGRSKNISDEKYFILIYNNKKIGFLSAKQVQSRFNVKKIFFLKKYNTKNFKDKTLLSIYDYCIKNKLSSNQLKWDIFSGVAQTIIMLLS